MIAALLSLALSSVLAPVPRAFAAQGGITSSFLSTADARSTVTSAHTAIALAHLPTRVAVKEPSRVRPSMAPANAWRPNVVRAARLANGVRLAGPRMLPPSEIDGVLRTAAARRRSLTSASANPPITAGRAGNPAGRALGPAMPGTRRSQSLPSDPSASGMGINPWWRYQVESVAGGGQMMVNVGTGNMLLQDDDMAVPHKGIELAFRRTYNSQSGHDVNATDATGLVFQPPGMYGNGWTSSFDAHIARNSALTVYSVFDIDGARYDYDAAWPAGTNGVFTPRAGNHASLVYDGMCGYFWTKKSGTTYYFYAPGPHAPCAQTGGSTEGYTGRLYQIVGRNRNTYLTLSYSWNGGVSSLTGKISEIDVQSESGLTAKLYFGDVNGHQLLQQLVFPDGHTSVSYGYDGNGNLTTVSRPPNNGPSDGSGTRSTQIYGYLPLGAGFLMEYAGSPRAYASCQTAVGCYGDGGGLWFGYAGSSSVSSTISTIQDYGSVNPTVPDTVSTGPIQGSAYPTSVYAYNTEYYTTGVTTATFRDTDGHMTNWVVDGLGRPTQTQVCTGSINQGQQCTGQWLVSNESWDASNNLVAEVSPRGYQTDYAYDSNGNTIAVAEPQASTSQGTFRPTTLVSYDSNNNVVAYCDPVATHRIPADWSAPPTAPPSGQGLCPQNSFSTRLQWTSTPSEPLGELTASTGPGTTAAPSGYTYTFAYQPASQGGTDYGLVTAITGDTIAQTPGNQAPANLHPTMTFQYDANGNEICFSNGSGTSVARYDALNRQTVVGDPDDGSVSGCGKGTSTFQTARYLSYYANGQVQYTETPVQHAADIAAGSTAAAQSFAYDLDGNMVTEIHHHGCAAIANCDAGLQPTPTTAQTGWSRSFNRTILQSTTTRTSG
ncbi:MAG TPA: DUF6531 domain-containing protein [Candidatus Elarobacter sp.]